MESLSAVLPITGIVLFISVFLVPMEVGTVMLFLAGAVMLILGMGFFQLGAEMAMTPIGEGIGHTVSKTPRAWLMVLIGFFMGAIITISEPDLQVLAEQVPSIPNLTLILTVAVGVGLFLALAVIRIKFRIDLSKLLILLYLALIGISFLVPGDFLAVAFDSGGVTTGPMTVPFIMAMGVGLASVRTDKDSASDSFGLVALSSVGPILAVLILGCFFKPTDASYALGEIPSVITTRDVVSLFAYEIPAYAGEVMISLLPIAAVFLLFQLMTRHYHKREVKRIVMGVLYTYAGLVLFLCGVGVGFAPVGTFLGEELASLSYNWVIVPIGMLIGYYIVKAEPAIQVLNRQVESITDGAISVKAMNRCMSIGVAILADFAKRAAALMPDADIEIVEVHHNRKVDAPSGTALMLFDAVKAVRPQAAAHCGRAGEGKRTQEEIGISSLRMVNVVGIHEVHICTPSQTLTLRHEAGNRGMLADGAVDAARFMGGKKPGLYTMTELLEEAECASCI